MDRLTLPNYYVRPSQVRPLSPDPSAHCPIFLPPTQPSHNDYSFFSHSSSHSPSSSCCFSEERRRDRETEQNRRQEKRRDGEEDNCLCLYIISSSSSSSVLLLLLFLVFWVAAVILPLPIVVDLQPPHAFGPYITSHNIAAAAEHTYLTYLTLPTMVNHHQPHSEPDFCISFPRSRSSRRL